MYKIGFIDYYLDEWHANNYPRMLKESSHGEIEVAYAYGQIPSPLTGKTSEEWCQEHGITQCESIADLINKSDAIIVLAPDNCEKHEELAHLALLSGKKTFIDKTFAPDKKSAEAMFRLGEAHQTPCYSASALRFAAEYQAHQGKRVTAMSTWGPNEIDTYSIHQLEPIMMLMQGPVRRVLALTQDKWTNLLLEWQDGRCATVFCSGGDAAFTANICLDTGSENMEITSDFFTAFIENLVNFFRTGEIPVSPQETIAIMAVREAALKAEKNSGVWVSVE